MVRVRVAFPVRTYLLPRKHSLYQTTLLLLAKHASSCSQGIDWENAKIIGKETGWMQRKYLEGIETLRQKHEGKVPLNAYNKMEQWQGTLYTLFDNDKRSDVK